jgi:hypothetical protein
MMSDDMDLAPPRRAAFMENGFAHIPVLEAIQHIASIREEQKDVSPPVFN